MSSPPVQMSDLPDGNSSLANDASAVVLMRSGLTDYKCAVSIIRQINLFILGQTSPISSDLMLISRGSASNPSNLAVTFGSVGFPKNTRMWFMNSLPPAPNWSLVPNTGDKLLACKDFTTSYANNTDVSVASGTWQQTNVANGNENGGLLINQIPGHTHYGKMDNTNGNSSSLFCAGQTGHSAFRNTSTYSTGGNGSTVNASNDSNPSTSTPLSDPHNHGNTWRPLANVGTIGNKDF